jgi:hypothetical protein
VTEDALDALALANDPPRVFRRAGTIVRLGLDEGTMEVALQPLTGKVLRNHVARVADWYRARVAISPPSAVVGDIEAASDVVGLPALDAVVAGREDRRQAHQNAPLGCAFVDQHMKDGEAKKRIAAGRHARLEGFAKNGPYSQVWHMLVQEGLLGGGEYAAANAELLRIKAKLAKRAAQQARRERREKRKKVRQ